MMEARKRGVLPSKRPDAKPPIKEFYVHSSKG
jgi:hypothetical protein